MIFYRFIVNKLGTRFFSLENSAANYRARIRLYFVTTAWLLFSLLVFSLYSFQVNINLQRFALVGLSLVKYLILLWIVYSIAKRISVKYLREILSVDEEYILLDFIEEVAFGGTTKTISIDEDDVVVKNENTSILTMVGPGFIQIHPGRIAILDRNDGNTEVVYPRRTPWELNSFDRIREVGDSAEVDHKYAIVSLQDQLINGLSVRSRTKEGIPIEVHDIKILFSMVKKNTSEHIDDNSFDVDQNAVMSLIENQTLINPSPKAVGVSFPWGTTVVPLIVDELQTFISSRRIDEILDYSREKVNFTHDKNRLRNQTSLQTDNENNPSKYSKINTVFFNQAFKEKAYQIGIEVQWIDAGRWQFPSGIILDELMATWKKLNEISESHSQIDILAIREEVKEVIELVRSVVISPYSQDDKISSIKRKLSEKEYKELAEMLEENPEIVLNPILQQTFMQNSIAKKEAIDKAIQIMKVIRRELIAARDLIGKENRSSIEKQIEIARIDNALRDIDFHIFHQIKK